MGNKFKINIRVSYNSPVILTYCLLCTLILILDTCFKSANIISNVFTVPGNFRSSEPFVPFDFSAALDYLKLFTHVLGHASWEHLAGNMAFILLIGPLLEERYGSLSIALMILITAFVTGILNACLIPVPLLGASGVAFMLIILSSFTSISKNEIPLSFIFVFVLFLGSEIFIKKEASNISVIAHVAGGLCGSMFGFLVAPKKSKPSKEPRQKKKRHSSDPMENIEEISGGIKPAPAKKEEEGEIVLGTIEL